MIKGLRARLNELNEKTKQNHTIPYGVKTECKVVVNSHDVDCMYGNIYIKNALYVPDEILYIISKRSGASLKKALYIDVETTGLSSGTGTVIFLLAIGYFRGDMYIVEQFFMRDFDEEDHMLDVFSKRLADFDSLITFNGKCFDVPFIESRMIMNRKPTNIREMPHIDLLHISRKLWKLRLVDCSLGSLESNVLGVARENDIAGIEIPARYFAYLKNKDEGLIDEVLKHNLYDMRALPALLSVITDSLLYPELLIDPIDIYSASRIFFSVKDYRKAEMLLKTIYSDNDSSQKARRLLALLYKRLLRLKDELIVNYDMINDRQNGIEPYISIAKIFEHKRKNYKKAYEMTDLALSNATPAQIPEITHRLNRLQNKLQKKDHNSFV